MALFYVINARKEKVCNAPIRLSDLSDDEIYQMTRFPRAAVNELVELMRDDLQHPTARSHAVPVDTQVLAALQFYGSGSFQWVVGRSCGISQSSVCLSVDAVTKSLVKRATEFIKFPTDQRTVVANKLAFNAVANFPNVLGAIDGTHVAIKAPSCSEDAYVNRKGVHTINVQAVCDMDMMFLDVCVKWPGSTHDAFIWRNSSLHSVFEQGYMPDGWLVGKCY